MNRAMAPIIITTFCLLFTGCAVRCSQGIYPEYSTGQRTGKLMQLSHKGVIWKRDKGEMLLNEFSINSGNNATSQQLFVFNTYDPEVIAQLETMIGQKIIVEYNQWCISPIWNDSSYEVVSVRLAEDDE